MIVDLATVRHRTKKKHSWPCPYLARPARRLSPYVSWLFSGFYARPSTLNSLQDGGPHSPPLQNAEEGRANPARSSDAAQQ